MIDAGFRDFNEIHERVERCKSSLRVILRSTEIPQNTSSIGAVIDQTSSHFTSMQPTISEALAKVTSACADSYVQACADVNDLARVSWKGTVHEIRDTMSTILRTLAPDSAVVSQEWFKPETQDGKPSQKQRARFILQQHPRNRETIDVVGQIDIIDDRIARMIRSTYTRASTAAHVGAERREAIAILKYFEAFAHDLLILE